MGLPAGMGGRVRTVASVMWLQILRRKDVYVLLMLLAATLAYLLGQEFFGSTDATRYLAEAGLLCSWLASWVLTIPVAARQLPAEEASGGVFFLLVKPLSKAELILGKWVGAWSIGAMGTAAFYVVTAAMVVVRGGRVPMGILLQGYLLHVVLLAILAALAILLSTRLTSEAAITLSFLLLAFCFVFLPQVPAMVEYADPVSGGVLSVLYYALPHVELFDLRQRIVHGWPPASWTVVAAVIGYALLWTVALLSASVAVYRRKSLQRSRVG